MRNKRNIRLVEREEETRDPSRRFSSRGSSKGWWVDVMLREKENERDERKWKKKKALRERKKGGQRNRRHSPVDDNDDGEGNFWQTREVFDGDPEEEEEDEYYGDSDDYYPRDKSGLPKIHPFDFGPTDILDPFSFAELQSLKAFPHLGQYVKTINFYGRTEGTPTALILKRFLKLCPNVETIILTRGQVRHFPDSVRAIQHVVKYAPKITSLTITDFGEVGIWDLFSAISKLSKLKHLSLTCTPDGGYLNEIDTETSDPAALPNSLTSFHFGSIATPEYYTAIPTSFARSITSLGVAVRRKVPDISNFSNVQHLTVTFGQYCHGVDFLRTVSTSQTIKSLELCGSELLSGIEWQERRNEETKAYDEYDEYDSEDEDGQGGGYGQPAEKFWENDSILHLFDYLPPNLESLSILFPVDTPSDKQFEEAILSKLPKSIRKITLLASIGDDKQEGRIGGGWNAEKMLENWLDKISKMLEKKGVDLYRCSVPYGGRSRSVGLRGLTEKHKLGQRY